MLTEIKYKNSIGNKMDIWRVICMINEFDEVSFDELIKIMIRVISRDSDIKNIIILLEITNIVSIKSGRIKLLMKFPNVNNFIDFINKEIIHNLKKKNEYYSFFGKSIRYNINHKKFYIKIYDINLSYSGLRDFLIDTELLIKDGSNLLFNEKYSTIHKKQKKTSLEELLKIKELQAEVGRKGEEYVVNYEKVRLLGHRYINDVIMISDLDVSAGYDIVSFENYESEINDRFIEVKTFSENYRFYWSRNEIEEARKLEDKYYLYLVNIREIKIQSYNPTIIQNPYRYFIENNNEDWVIQNEQLRITKL